MSEFDEPGSSRRATDGLDWRQSPGSRQVDDPFPPMPSGPAAAPPPPGNDRRAGFGIGTLIGVALTAALGAGILSALLVARFDGNADADDGDSTAQPGSSQSVSVEQTSAIADVAANWRSSVVRIESTKTNGGTVEHDVGSGVVIDAQGHILTNAHIVLGTDSLKVILSDGEERPAILVGHDYPFTDVAVLQIGPGNLNPLRIGDSSKLVLGQTVIAIGNPLAEFDGSVTVGVVSGLDRVRVFDAVRQGDLIQTDAAVNSGNSGGALLDLQGNFVGMPTAVLRESRSSAPVEGIAFALPSNRLLQVANAIIANSGSLDRASLGIDHVDIGLDTTVRLPRLAVSAGALVVTVAKGGPADGAGIQAGDVITSLAGKEVTVTTPLLNAVVDEKPGTTVKVVLNRQGKIIEAEVRLASR